MAKNILVNNQSNGNTLLKQSKLLQASKIFEKSDRTKAYDLQQQVLP